MSKSKSTFRLLFYINRSKANQKEECPIMLRVTINGKSIALSLQRLIHPDNWETNKALAKAKSPGADSLNVFIEAMRAKAFNKYMELRSLLDDVSPEQVRDAMLGINTAQSRTLLDVWQEHVDDLHKLIGRGTSKANHQKFSACKRYMGEFLQKEYKCKDISLKNVDRRLVTRFEMFLKTEKNCSFNTTTKYLQNFKKITRIGLHNGWMKINPFTEYKLTLKEVDRPYLDEAELKSLMGKVFMLKRLEHVRDIFVFSCFTGLAYADIKKLNAGEIEKAPDGSVWIRSRRLKTGVSAHIPLLQVPIQLLEKYSEYAKINKTLLPINSNQKMNAYLNPDYAVEIFIFKSIG